ncbi:MULTISPECIES: IS66-like element accessory protein TnpA [Sphingomonadaceae]|jgi:transposase|uniref:Transposase IS3/IS911 n=1 Tax=Novosphingobium resinovorum TaxID=158500 RepID=A0A031K342_9SPHN|nr:transposase [Novosphingobium resinovorum]EZP83428.1 Transposase IS3/IS911 [Novosphingobium resinovorum]MEC3947696.1 transposase [Sphingobium sp. HWE2-09]GLK42668.1 transposase [Novosphingobium resinovorum]
MGQITVFSGPERRRRWNDEERQEILNEAFAPGACVAEVARRHDVSTALVYTWRRKLRDAVVEPEPGDLAAPGFAAAVMIEDLDVAPSELQPAIVIDLARGKRISIFASASPVLVAAALKALR